MGLNLKAFFFTAMLFSLISVVIDFTTKIDPIIENQISFKDAVLSYFIHFVSFINGMLWPIFALISVIFVTSRLAKNSEIISLLNAGIGFRRIMVPFCLTAAIIFTLHMLGNHYVIPMGGKVRIPFENERLSNNTRSESNLRHIHALVDSKTKLYIRQYRERDSMALNFRLEKYGDDAQLVSFVESARAQWNGGNSWTLKNYTQRNFSGLAENVSATLVEKDTMVAFTPDEIKRVKNQHQLMTSSELRAYISKQRKRGLGGTRIFETELYRRSAEPFSILVLTVIGMAVASRKVRGGIGLHLAIGIMLGAFFIVLSRFSMTFSNADSIGPIIGTWIPNLLFSLVAVYLIRIAQK